MRIQNLSIQGFRGLQRLEMNGLGRINLIVGANNCGKTTVLEATKILMANGDTSAIWSMLWQRGEAIGVDPTEPELSSKPIQIWRLFRGHDIKVDAHFEIKANTDTDLSAVRATIEEYDPVGGQSLGVVFPPVDPSEEFQPPVFVRIKWSREQSSGAELLIPIRGRDRVSSMALRPNHRPGSLGVSLRFLNASSLTVESVISLLDDIVLTPEEDLVIDALKIIEPSIQRIASSGSDRLRSGDRVSMRGGLLVRLEGVNHRVPIGSMGDGIWRMLGLALNVVHSLDGILLVDDIDTGLHHTVMDDMWKFLDATSRKYNVQVFATTHSRDCYEALAAIANGPVSDTDTNEVTIQRIERGREKAVAYTEQTIAAAAKHGYEVALIMAKINPNILLVEGDEEKRVIPYLMDHHVVWGDKIDEWVVEIQAHGGIDDVLDPGNIKAAAMVPGRNAVGIFVDANDHLHSRWARARQCCLGIAADFPTALPSEGLIHQNEQGLRIGVWIMPDNQSRGMLETFLSHLIVPADAPLWAFAQESCARSRDHGAAYTDPHRDKANIHTYLAWRDPPGMKLHVSVIAKALDARLPLADRFAKWLIELYQLAPR